MLQSFPLEVTCFTIGMRKLRNKVNSIGQEQSQTRPCPLEQINSFTWSWHITLKVTSYKYLIKTLSYYTREASDKIRIDWNFPLKLESKQAPFFPCTSSLALKDPKIAHKWMFLWYLWLISKNRSNGNLMRKPALKRFPIQFLNSKGLN